MTTSSEPKKERTIGEIETVLFALNEIERMQLEVLSEDNQLHIKGACLYELGGDDLGNLVTRVNKCLTEVLVRECNLLRIKLAGELNMHAADLKSAAR